MLPRNRRASPPYHLGDLGVWKMAKEKPKPKGTRKVQQSKTYTQPYKHEGLADSVV
jgi:hypothetical protein